MRSFTILFFLGCAFFTQAQEKPPGFKPSFRSSFGVALINGAASTSFNVQSVNGVLINKSFAGLGIGIDYYKFRSVPVFLQLRQEFGRGKKHALVYADGGYNIAWLTDKMKEEWWQGTVEYRGGLYYDFGVGYRILMKENAVVLTTGYSFKEIRRNQKYMNCAFGGQCVDESDRYLYGMSRISVRAAFQF